MIDGFGGVMHTNQIKPVHAVRTHLALRHGALFGWADYETNFEKLDKQTLPLWMIYYSKCDEWSCCKFRHFTIKKWTGAVSGRIHARTRNAAGYQRRTGTPFEKTRGFWNFFPKKMCPKASYFFGGEGHMHRCPPLHNAIGCQQRWFADIQSILLHECSRQIWLGVSWFS